MAMQVKQIKFEGVHGYKTYETAQKRGEKVAADRSDMAYRWMVIALPNGRFAPCVVINNSVPGGPGSFLGEANVCLVN